MENSLWNEQWQERLDAFLEGATIAVNPNGQCGSCAHFAQGENCSFCDNPKQTNENLKEYTYYPLGCALQEPGTHKSRIEFMERMGAVI